MESALPVHTWGVVRNHAVDNFTHSHLIILPFLSHIGTYDVISLLMSAQLMKLKQHLTTHQGVRVREREREF